MLTPAEVAERLHLTRETVYRLIERGELPSSRVGSALRITTAQLASYLREHAIATDAHAM